MKKILNIFAGLSLITATASSVTACWSHPHVPPTEVQKLYNELNETTTPFLIQNKNFWGKEANYQTDLLQDLEKIAHIPAQDDKMLSFNGQIKPFETPGQIYHIAVKIKNPNTDEEKTAYVNIDWELTTEQSEIYNFYTNIWPSYIESEYEEGDPIYGAVNNLYKSVIDPSTKKWATDLEQTLTWQQYAAWLEKSDKWALPSKLQNDFRVKQNVGIDHLNVDQKQTLQTSPFYLQVGTVTFDLPYYVWDINYPFHSEIPPKILPKTQLWTVNYNNDYHMLQELKEDIAKDRGLLPLNIREPNSNPSQASSFTNTQKINDAISNLYVIIGDSLRDYSRLSESGHMAYSGTLYATKEYPSKGLTVINQINFSYYGIKQDFTLPVEADYWTV